MKKLLAIFLLAVTFYNVGGYMLAFEYFIFRSDKLSEQRISKENYKETDLVEIKIPVHLPGMDPWRGYENVSGSVELSQNSYNYVRMKMTTDTIYVMCVPNIKTTKLKKDNVICARDVSDAPLNSKKQTSPVKTLTMVKYVTIVKRPAHPSQKGMLVSLPVISKSKILTGALTTPAQPPRIIFLLITY